MSFEMSMKGVRYCEVCGGSDVVVDRGKTYCRGCGAEINNNVYFRVDGSFRERNLEKNLGRIKRLNKVIDEVIDYLNLNDEIKTNVIRCIERCVKNTYDETKIDSHAVSAYCLWITLRKEGIPIPLPKILEVFNNIFRRKLRLKHIYKLRKQLINVKDGNIENISIKPQDYINYVFDMIYKTGRIRDYKTYIMIKGRALQISELIERYASITNPRVVAGSSIYLAYLLARKDNFNNLNLAKLDFEYICSLLSISKFTIKKRSKQLIKKLSFLSHVGAIQSVNINF